MPSYQPLGSGTLNLPKIPTSFAQPNVAQGISIGASGTPQGGAIAPPPPSNTQTAMLLTGQGGIPTSGAWQGPLAQPTATGGYTIHPAATPAAAAPASNTHTLPGGSTANFTSTGSLTGVSPAPFSIDTSATVPSSTLTGSPTSPADLQSKRNSYADYAQKLYEATIPSSDYLGAVQQLQDAQQQGKQITANYYTAPIGDTVDYAQGTTARAQALNSLQQNAAANNLNVQQLIRSGNIDAYKALVGAAAPQSVSPGSSLVNPMTGQEQYSGLGGYQAVQGIQTVMNLMQSHPDAGVTPTDNPVLAAQKVNQSASFQAGNLIAYATPSGGIGYINKLDINKLQRNTDGTYQLLGGADATAQSAAKATITDLTQQRAQVASAVTTADANFPLLLQAAQAAGVNNSSPLVNQLEQKLGSKFSTSPAYAALTTLIPSLQTEYARIISRGGSVDDNTRNSASAIVNGTFNLSQLQAVYNTVKAESSNVLKGYDTEITRQNAVLNGQGSSTTSSSGTSSSLYDF